MSYERPRLLPGWGLLFFLANQQCWNLLAAILSNRCGIIFASLASFFNFWRREEPSISHSFPFSSAHNGLTSDWSQDSESFCTLQILYAENCVKWHFLSSPQSITVRNTNLLLIPPCTYFRISNATSFYAPWWLINQATLTLQACDNRYQAPDAWRPRTWRRHWAETTAWFFSPSPALRRPIRARSQADMMSTLSALTPSASSPLLNDANGALAGVDTCVTKCAKEFYLKIFVQKITQCSSQFWKGKRGGGGG